MAEMTAAEALGVLGGSEKQPQSEQELITSIIAGMTRGEKCFVLLWDSERTQIAALIEQQAAEIAKKDRMLGKLLERNVWRYCPPMSSPDCFPSDQIKATCVGCWRKWLEKEAEVQG